MIKRSNKLNCDSSTSPHSMNVQLKVPNMDLGFASFYITHLVELIVILNVPLLNNC